MATEQPRGPLWEAVRAIYDPWPTDTEEAAVRVGAAWRKGHDVVDQGARDTVQVRTDLASMWGGDSGPAVQSGLAGFAEATGPVRERMLALELMGQHYANELASAKIAIVDAVGRGELLYAFWGNPLFGDLGTGIQKDIANQIATELRGMIAEKAAALRANPTGAPPPPPPVPEEGGWDLSTLAHGALDVVGLIPGVGEIADGVNAAWYAAEGDYANAALSAAAMIPGAGAAAIAAKYGKKIFDAATAARGVEKRVGAVDPIDVATGEMFLHQTDLDLPGLLPLLLTRTHLSSYRAGVSFGPTWSSTVDQRLEFHEDGVACFADQGIMLLYPPVPAGTAVLPEFGPRWPLRRDGSGYVIDKPGEGVRLKFGPADRDTARLAAIVDRNDQRLTIARDAHGIPCEVRHSGGYHVVFDSEDGLITGMRLRTGATSVPLAGYRYDSASRLTEVTNSSGLPLRFSYDPAGRIVRWEDRNTHWYTYVYDTQGRCVRTDGAGGFLTGRLAYAPGRTVVTDALGARTTYELNERGQVVRETDPLGNTTTSTWDPYDRLLSRTDPLCRTSHRVYDQDGNLVRLVRPDGRGTTVTYNTLRQPITVTYPDGGVWRYDYDPRGNLISLSDPTGAHTRYTYTADGRLASATDPLGHHVRIETDPAGLPLTVTDPLGARTRYDRDTFGRVSRIVDPLNGVTRLRWTVEGNLISRTLPDGATELWRYDGEGNQTEHIDAVGQVTRTDYIAFDLPAARTSPDGTRYEFAYDAALRLTSVTNPQGLVWRYDYDPAGRLRSETDFNGRTVTYTHDAAGRLFERVNGAGQVIRFVRDVLGNVATRHVDDVVTTFTRDGLGHLLRADAPDTSLVIERDPMGRVVAETVDGRTLRSTYDLLGRRIRRTTPSGAETRWDYDQNHRPVAMHTAGRTVRFDYDPAGREVRRAVDDIAILAQSWDPNGRLLSQILTAVSGHPIAYRAYSYRADGHLTGLDDQLTGPRTYDLDRAGQVTAVRAAGWTERYAYDDAGNITAGTWSGAAEPQDVREYSGTLIRRAGGTTYEHDDQGRTVLRRRRTLSGTVLTWHYSWDGDDRLTRVTTPDGTVWRYRYDPLGRRIAKQRLDGDRVVEQVEFSWDGSALAEQTCARPTGALSTTTWEWMPGTNRPVSQTERAPLRDAPQQWVDDQFYAIVTDLVGTPTELIDTDGQVAWHTRTTIWGVPTARDTGRAYCPLRFPGQYHDSETGQNYNHHRYYDVDTARYHSPDPLGLAPAPNPHRYVDNPLVTIDPLGLAPTCTLETVYRNLAETDDPLVGLTAKNPDATYTPAGHITHGSRPGWESQYISTTASMDVLKRWNEGRAVAIDLNKFDGTVIDASTQAARDAAGIRGFSANRLADNAKEVLLEGFVPPEAITWIGKL